ncbi:hypothetical protein [Streptomyces albus]|nr:hypothetical protein [Streptomyces albus]
MDSGRKEARHTTGTCDDGSGGVITGRRGSDADDCIALWPGLLDCPR